jgi:hypothetical protein
VEAQTETERVKDAHGPKAQPRRAEISHITHHFGPFQYKFGISALFNTPFCLTPVISETKAYFRQKKFPEIFAD